MSYFIPSFLQKRILRYALSRLELLDTDALDLEKLDIIWGKRSTIELRDVGINIEKISALLKLPRAFSITRAKISTLLVTIPADLYQSNIVLEVEGLEIDVKADVVDDGEKAKINCKTSKQASSTPSQAVKADRKKDTSYIVRDGKEIPTGTEFGEDEDAHLPTTFDLAESFVQAEPMEERSELQAAVAHSLHLSQSHSLEKSASEYSEVGMGNNISLPGFLAAYLKGVGDRVKATISNIKMDLALRMANRNIPPWMEDVKIRLQIDSVTIGEIVEDITKKQKRSITLQNTQLIVISDQSLFSNMARSSVPSSPETMEASVAATARDKANESSSSLAEIASPILDTDDMEQNIAASDANQAFIFSAENSFVDRQGQNQGSSARLSPEYRTTAPSFHQDNTSTDSFYSTGEYSNLHNMTAETAQLPQNSDVHGMYDEISSTRDSPRNDALLEFGRLEDSPPAIFNAFPTLNQQRTPENQNLTAFSLSHDDGDPEILMEDLPENSKEFSSPTGTPSCPSPEDLSESRIFSHDQRESIYMSAIGGIPLTFQEDSPPIPGAWESDYTDDGPSTAKVTKRSEPEFDKNFHHEAQEARIRESYDNAVPEGRKSDMPSSSAFSSLADRPERQRSLSSISHTLRTEPVVSDNTATSLQYTESASSSRKDSLLLAKRVLSIDNISLEIPSGIPNDSSHSLFGNDPRMALGVASTTKSQYDLPWSSGTTQRSQRSPRSSDDANEDPSQPITSIIIGEIQVMGDVGLTKLTVLLAEQLSASCQPHSISKQKLNPRPSPPSHYVLTVHCFSWRFVELVKAVSIPESAYAERILPYAMFYEGADVLLQSHVRNILLDRAYSENTSRTKMSVRKFSIGYVDANILSFDASLKMGSSVRDISPNVGKDLDLTIVESSGNEYFDITCLPVHVILDLRRLDETFSWFGGFSSILGLGSSMMSTVTQLEPKAAALQSKKPSRGVHFDSPVPGGIQRQGAGNQLRKITSRIGGLVFDIQGAKSGVRIESSALKLVSRTEGLGLQIDRLSLNGPIVDSYYNEIPILAKLANVRLEYLTIPKENDLTRLLTLLAPSKDTYDDGDDILIDTLLRQRKKGGVVRATIENANVHLLDTPALQCLPALAEEAKKLSKMAKYLPEDDRPGILTLLLIKSLKFEAHVNEHFGVACWRSKNVEIANITFPSLTALGISDLHLSRNGSEELVGQAAVSKTNTSLAASDPMILARFIGNEMEPTVKVKFHNVRFEYHIATVMAIMNLKPETAPEEMVSDLVTSVATLTGQNPALASPSKLSSQKSANTKVLGGLGALKFNIAYRDVIFGLNPRNSNAKALLVLTDSHFIGFLPHEADANSTLDIRRAEIMIVDDVSSLQEPNPSSPRKPVDTSFNQVQTLTDAGYVSVSQISAARIVVQVIQSQPESGSLIDVEIRDELFVLESCADSTQTAIEILSGLKPTTPKSIAVKYQTEVVPVEDMFTSFSGEAFEMSRARPPSKAYENLDDYESDLVEDDTPDLEFVSGYHDSISEVPRAEHMTDSMSDNTLDSITVPSISTESRNELSPERIHEEDQRAHDGSHLVFHDDHFSLDSSIGCAAHKWNPQRNTYGFSKEKRSRSPLQVRMRDVHIIWNLFDGYDWQRTRDEISQAVAEIQNKAVERQAARKRKSLDPEEDEEDVIGDFLFNSIYIGIPAKSDPFELARNINRNIDDLASETGSYATSKSGGISPSRVQPVLPRNKRLRLQRSKYHKLTFELKGVSADWVVSPPKSGEIQSSIDVRVQDLEIFDHVPTSTWKKFATYMHDAGERESGAPMIHLELLNVKPLPDLAASEIILKASVLPLRLHVDQDTLDFVTRFFDFRDDKVSDSASQKAEAPFIQRAEFKSIRVRLDFKPKRIDYGGLRSGRTTEFMNFFVLDSADMVLRHAIVYGVSGFDRLGKTLNDIWMPDIKRNQLPNVLAGLAPVRSLVSVGGGMRDLVVVPIREYKKDGRVVRSFQKGALAFAKTTTSELMRLGAKLAIGTQTVLQSAEDVLNQPRGSQNAQDIVSGWDESDIDEDEKKRISLYADQPVGVIQGLRGAYASLERDLLTAKDAVVAMPGEIMESGTAGGAAKAILRGAPTVILRPAMGVSKAVGQTLMGATNTLDPESRRRIEDKYKRH